MQIHLKTGSWLALFVLLGMLLGCGGGDIGTVSGTILFDGTPLNGAVIEFYPQGGGDASAARTDTNGKYELQRGRKGKGAVVGDHKVLVSTALGVADSGDYGKPPRETIPAKYNAKTELIRTVNAGRNVIDFELDSQGEIVQQPGADGRR